MSPLWLLLVSAHCLSVHAGTSDCPADAALKKIIKDSTKVIQLKAIDGTWMVVQAPEAEVKDMTATYSSFDITEAKTEVEISVHDYKKGGGQDMYFQTMKLKPGENKGTFLWTGKYSDDLTINKDTFFFHADTHVLGFYSCDAALDMDKGWTVRILVNAADRKDLLDDGDNDTKKSLKAAVTALEKMKAEEAKWKTAHAGKFGLFGPITQMPLKDLMPEDYKPGDDDGRIL